MLPYWLLFLVPAVAALHERPVQSRSGQHRPFLMGAFLLLTIMIGFRYEVGGDWGAYLNYLYNTKYMPFDTVFNQSDPGYILLNWIAAQTFDEVWVVNLLCGLIFSIGLFTFAKIQPRPWLALLVAVPYLVIVVAMGYSRQGVAIGLAMLALVALGRKKSNVKFVIWIALAACFHKTAIMLVPIAALSADRGRIWTGVWIGAATLLLYYLFLESSVDSLVSGYIDAEYQSQGAAIRVAMNALPAAMFLLARRRFQLLPIEQRLWTNIALVALAFIVFLMVSPSSTAVDRMALYIIPIQIFVLSRLPEAFSGRIRGINPITLAVVVYSAAVQFVWLNFGEHARAWLPYQFYPLG